MWKEDYFQWKDISNHRKYLNHSTISHPKLGSNGDQFRNVPKSSFCETNILAMAILDDNELDVSDIKHQSRTLLLFHGKRTNRRNGKNSLHYYSVDRCAVAGFLSCHLLTRLLKPQDFSSFSVYWVVCRCLAQNTTLHRIICCKSRPNECISVCECSYLLYMLFPLCVLFLFDYYYLLFNF